MDEGIDVAIPGADIEIPAGLVICLDFKTFGGIPAEGRAKPWYVPMLNEGSTGYEERILKQCGFGAYFVKIANDMQFIRNRDICAVVCAISGRKSAAVSGCKRLAIVIGEIGREPFCRASS